LVIDRGKRILGTLAEELSQAATKRLERLGVEVRHGVGVDSIDADGVTVAGERILSISAFSHWPAGEGVTPEAVCERNRISPFRALPMFSSSVIWHHSIRGATPYRESPRLRSNRAGMPAG
jgi:hypothetical protein